MEIYAAIITGLFGLLTGLIPYILQLRTERMNRSYVNPSLRQALSGHWKGMIHQDLGPDGIEITYSADLNLEVKERNVEGSLQINALTSIGEIEANLILNGGVYESRFLRLNYINRNTAFLHFGTFIIEIQPNPNFLLGKFAGYGAFSKKVVSGTLELKKV